MVLEKWVRTLAEFTELAKIKKNKKMKEMLDKIRIIPEEIRKYIVKMFIE
jgi:hypothetical protein